MTPVAVIRAAEAVVASSEKRVEVRVPKNVRPDAFMVMLRRQLYKVYACGVSISREPRGGRWWLHVMKPVIAEARL